MRINIKGITETRSVFLNGEELSPKKSLKIWNHSPDGFNWGYVGSGPAQLALAILLEIVPRQFAIENHQKFKFNVISKLPQGKDFDIIIDIPEDIENNKFENENH